jgi:hypothetical protein
MNLCIGKSFQRIEKADDKARCDKAPILASTFSVCLIYLYDEKLTQRCLATLLSFWKYRRRDDYMHKYHSSIFVSCIVYQDYCFNLSLLFLLTIVRRLVMRRT